MEQYKPRGGEHAASESSIKVSRDSKGWFSAGGLAAPVRPCLLEHARMPDRSTTHTCWGFAAATVLVWFVCPICWLDATNKEDLESLWK